MRTRFLAADSLGVRSLSLALETSEGLIVIDPGASLAPRRYGLPPHPLEARALEESLNRIRDALRESSIVVITHYHYDHYIRGEPELYRGKTLIVKDPRRSINRSQAIRSHRFLKREGVESIARVLVGDSRSFRVGRVRIDVSPPVWHGYPGTRVGWVIMVRVIDENTGESIIYTSDAQGPADPDALEVLRSWSEPRPTLLVVDGPPTYFAGFKVPVEHVKAGLEGLEAAVRWLRPEATVVDHHLVRDLHYRDKLPSALRSFTRIETAASYMGLEEELLEARRKELWKGGSGFS